MRGRPAKLSAYHRIRGSLIAAPSPAPPSAPIHLRSLNQTAHEQNVDQSEHRRHPGNEIKHSCASVGPVPAPRRASPVRTPADASAIGQSLGLSSAESTCPLDRQFAGGAREKKASRVSRFPRFPIENDPGWQEVGNMNEKDLGWRIEHDDTSQTHPGSYLGHGREKSAVSAFLRASAHALPQPRRCAPGACPPPETPADGGVSSDSLGNP